MYLAMKLTSLPVELILKIFYALNWRTLLDCRQVCSLFRSIIESSSKVQYDIELAVSGMVDGPLSQLTATDRLSLLKEFNTSWESLRWKESNDIPMQQGHVWELYGGVYAQSSSSNALHFRQLPSQCRKIEEKSWHVAMDIFVRDFTMDPGQDLLVLIEHPTLLSNSHGMERQVRIHLRSLTTGDKHRLAPQPAFLVPNLDLRGGRPVAYTLRVCGNLLGVYFMSHGITAPELTVWNWATGKVILTRSCPDITTFAFLSSRFLLVGSNLDMENTQPCLYVLDMSHSSSEKIALTSDYFCAFAWPQFSDWTSLVAFSICSDPSPDWEPNPEAQLPFSFAHQHRLFIITSCVLTAYGRESSDLFVSADTLLSHIEALPTGTLQHDINWDEWGPTGTRLMPSPFSPSPWVCHVSGTKFATFVTPRRRLDPDSLEVRDFNQLAMKRAAESSKNLVPQDEIAQHVYDPSVIKAGVFMDDVRTSLPYRFTRRTLPCSSTQAFLTAVMCSEDNLILVDSNHRHIRVLTF